jgi:hypothetical protein
MSDVPAAVITRKAWLALAAAGLAMFLVGVDGSVTNVAFPSFKKISMEYRALSFHGF